MNFYEKAKALMDMEATEFTGGVSEQEIARAMNALSVVFPESYKAFLKDFGGGDAGGEIIFGITGNEEDDVVTVTQMERSQGLPEPLVIIGFWSDTLLCLALNDDYSQRELEADTFGTFLYEYLAEE